jgi:hypothetical protein
MPVIPAIRVIATEMDQGEFGQEKSMKVCLGLKK